MKYPQLVSPRAVNAISDWLVSRLEQLGVESPQIYTRLLLSLLQSSVQVNDPIEFSNLEAFIANRKGGHSKRYHLPFDTETLKKLNAVQCLREIVSNEQETAAIERLVDELCEKLKDIEKRTQELNDEERFLIDTQLNIEPLLQSAGSNNHQQLSAFNQQQQQQQQQQKPHHQLCHNSSAQVVSISDHSRRQVPSENALNDTDNDPKKRYFRAFPALSKEMEDSFRIWRRNAKSLTWPIVGRSSIVADTSRTSNNSISSSSASSSISSSNFDGNNTSADKAAEKKLKARDHLEEEFNTAKFVVGEAADVCGRAGTGDIGSTAVGGDVQGAAVGAAASAKKKSKRRRNQALCKGKPVQNIRKPTASSNTSNPSGGSGKFYSQHQYSGAHHRNASPTWDTDFKGCWEMGPDLIKEFLARQKGGTNKRSRSNSDSMDHEECNEYKMLNEMPKGETLRRSSGIEKRPQMKRYFDISFCCDDDDDRHPYDVEECVNYVDEDYDDDNTLASVEELVSGATCNARRLYQRESNLQKSLAVCNVVDDSHLDETSESVDQFDFASFKAKFNSSVEALWKDAEPLATSTNATNSTTSTTTQVKGNPAGISSAFYATTSLNALAPFKQDLWNFWSNYNQQNYDQLTKFSTTASTSSMITTRLDDSSASSGAGADIANSSDYFSMPSNLDDFDKSVGAVRRVNEAGASLGAHTPSINVFLQNSIWSSSGDCVDAVGAAVAAVAAAETDESFLYKVWHSNKKLSQIEVGNNTDEKKIATMNSDGESSTVGFSKSKEPMATGGGNGAKLEFPPYNSLKWSEGINAGPPYNSLRANNASTDVESLNKADSKFVAFSSTAAATGATWEAPAYGQNAQPDLKSWCASNPMSLTEMYGSDVCDSITQENESLDDADEEPPSVTLPNHCATTSGFIAYARIKQSGLIQPQSKPLQQQQIDSNAAASLTSNEYFRAGEEENLLTSERTHFHPIENYVDGHTFDISNCLDSVDFERSASGYLFYESEEYLEYTRNDVYLADEEVANTNLMNFAAAASSQSSDGGKDRAECKEMFVLKFRLKRSGEIACQTEEIDFQLAAAKMSESHCEERMEMPIFANPSLALSSRQTNNEVIMAAVTKAVAAAAKAAAEQGLNAGHSSLSWVPATRKDSNQPSWVQDVSLCDEVDFCRATASAEQLSQFWSMQEVEKQCHQRRLPAAFQRADLDRNDDSSLDNSSHTLWGMCAVCNSCDYGKSLPANRLLRDELKLEADEIMSDLRYMQDLYIGEADSVADNAANDDVDKNSEMLKRIGNEAGSLQDKHEVTAVDHVQASMLLKVNQLIEDLLRPEQTGKLIKTKEEDEMGKPGKQITNDVWAMNTDDDAVDNSHSWHYGGGGATEQLNNIWQHESQTMPVANENDAERKLACMKPMKLLRQVGGSLNEEDLYMDKLNWEHENLARIWQRNIFSTAPSSAASVLLQSGDEKSNECDNVVGSADRPGDIESQEIVERKNLKNLQNLTNTASHSAGSTASTYKRVQQFLNTSAAKLKLAANRKRRHSASQNFYHQQQQQQSLGNANNNNGESSGHGNSNTSSNNNNNNNNNNNDNITDLNRYQQKLGASGISTAEELPFEPKQTIITCKYWTTSTNGTQASLDSAAAAMMLLAAAANKRAGAGGGVADNGVAMMTANSNYEDTNVDECIMLEENTFGNTFSCLIDKNASILKHVTMMTRPLTR